MNNRVCGESVNTARDGRHLLDAWSTDATPSDVQSRERRRRYPSDMSAAGPLLDHSTSREGEGGGPHINGPPLRFRLIRPIRVTYSPAQTPKRDKFAAHQSW